MLCTFFPPVFFYFSVSLVKSDHVFSKKWTMSLLFFLTSAYSVSSCSRFWNIAWTLVLILAEYWSPLESLKKQTNKQTTPPTSYIDLISTDSGLIHLSLGRTRWWRSWWTWSTSFSTDTSGIHLQTQKCLQNTSWEWTRIPDQWKRIYRPTQNSVGWRN